MQSYLDARMDSSCLLFLLMFYCLVVLFSCEIPRLTLRQDSLHHRFIYDKNVSHTVFFYRDGSEKLYLGWSNYILVLNELNLVENFTLPPSKDCSYESCYEYVVTVIEEFENYLLVCGTNGEKPTCWKLHSRENNQWERLDGSGVSPYTISQNYLSLAVDGDLYAAAPLYKDGTSLQFRRQGGKQTRVWMYDPWITEPTFISAFVARRYEDPINEKIYVLFREKNSDSSPDADPWISRVARVCKVDKGGSKRLFQHNWTSFLKARLVCAVPGESLYFNRLQDTFVLHSENWRDSVVYALFSSIWNATAVCTYSLAELDAVFENSRFKGYNERIPTPRPGTCVEDSRTLPSHTIRVLKDHPEMTDWVHPIQKHAPLYMSNENYTKIAVDRVEAADGNMYNVMLLSTDTGMIHKILEHDSKAFIISETSLCNGSAPVLSLKLNSEKRKLFLGYPGQLSVFDLQRCQDYNASCQDCVLARDPYCAWTEHGCTSHIQGGIQNIATGEPSICNEKTGPNRHKRDVLSSSPAPRIDHIVPQGVPFYLSCPIESHHATYTWMHKKISKPCQKVQSNCLHLIPDVSADDYGIYKCISIEHGYTKIVKEYYMHKPNRALQLTWQKEWLLGVLAAVLSTVH